MARYYETALRGGSNPHWRGGNRSAVCRVCGCSYKVIPANYAKTKYCSYQCRYNSKSKRKSNLFLVIVRRQVRKIRESSHRLLIRSLRVRERKPLQAVSPTCVVFKKPKRRSPSRKVVLGCHKTRTKCYRSCLRRPRKGKRHFCKICRVWINKNRTFCPDCTVWGKSAQSVPCMFCKKPCLRHAKQLAAQSKVYCLQCRGDGLSGENNPNWNDHQAKLQSRKCH